MSEKRGFRYSRLALLVWIVICAAAAMFGLAFLLAAFGAALPFNEWSWSKAGAVFAWCISALVCGQLFLYSLIYLRECLAVRRARAQRDK